MLKYLPVLITLFVYNSYADPFYKEDNTVQHQSIVKNSEKQIACQPPNSQESLSLETKFEQLKFIGIIQIEDQIKALFIDGEQQIIDLKKDVVIFPSMIEIKEINLKSIKYIDWANSTDCLNPIWITKKL